MGSALDYILDYPNAVNQTDFKLWAAQIASGMTYLEEKGLILLVHIYIFCNRINVYKINLRKYKVSFQKFCF